MKSRNLLDDTIYRRARGAIVRTLHEADELVSRLGRSEVRVLFEAATPMNLAVFRPVLDQLQRDRRFEFWFTTADGVWSVDDIFRAAGITERLVAPGAARWMKFDAYVNTDFWNMTWLKRRARRIHLFHGVAGSTDSTRPCASPRSSPASTGSCSRTETGSSATRRQVSSTRTARKRRSSDIPKSIAWSMERSTGAPSSSRSGSIPTCPPSCTRRRGRPIHR